MKEYKNYQAYYEDSNDFIIWLFFCLGLILLLLIVSRIAFSIFEGGVDRPVTPIDPNIVFNYSDVNGVGPGIYISNMAAMPDDVGKKLTGKNNYFDFSVSGDLKNNAVKYSILLKKDNDSTLEDNKVKIYLTRLNGSNESEVYDNIPLYSELSDIEVKDNNYKVLFEKTYNNFTTEFNDNYRLRMWISENATDYYAKKYSLKVSVLAEGLGE